MSVAVVPPERFAIIGIGCRMPPSGNSLATFWRFLLRGGNALKPIKKDRWDWRQYFDEDQRRPGKSYAPKGGFLDADVQQFDPLAFGISPREANCLDPQQRLLLEVAWEAFEDAGVPLERASGSATGVFIGGFCLDHLILHTQPSNRYLANAHSPAGVTMTVLSNRISHVFNLRGPSLTLDTACSSSLVAIHYACLSLRSGESEMALAGGVNVMTRPDFPILMSKGHFLSPHGECHTFDETAAGYARGEGAGVFLIKPYEKALADGDRIHAIIRGTGVNQDGHTDGISLPNSEAQESLVRRVYRQAGVAPAEVDYVEAHGTGTQAGDPAETRALDAHFAHDRDPRNKLHVGSVKSNIGHLEAAAGVAGLLKAVGVLKFRQIPKNLHFTHPNPKIPFSDYCLKVVTETAALPSPEEKPTLFAGVNSFGYGGTNAHVLLESAPPETPGSTRETKADLQIVPFSARSEKALRDLAGKFAFQLGQGFAGSLGDVAATTAFRRSHLEFRGTALASSLEELREQWIAASTGEPREGLCTGRNSDPAGLVFVYTGMGPQWWAMGQELMREEPIVRQTVEEIDALFAPLAGWSLKDAMMAQEGASRMDRTEVAQPANFALQAALTRLWASYGIRPAAVVGHSVGEVCSAYAAGVYSLEEAVLVSYHRSHWQQTMAGLGSMLAVGLPEAEALALIRDFPGVSIAAINSFSAVTLSGDSGQLQQIADLLAQREIFQRALRVEVAYHSPQMDPLREPLLQALAGLAPKPARLPLYSTAFGKIVPHEDWNAGYWWHNVRQPVRFAPAMEALFTDGYAAFLEIGPHPVLGNSIKECAAHLEKKISCFTSLKRKEPERRRIFSAVAELYCAGYPIDWKTLAPAGGAFIPGPQYPWQRQLHWLESDRSRMERFGLPGPVYLNRTVLGPTQSWEVEINKNYFPFLFDHRVQDQTVFAGMGYIEAALALNERLHETPGVVMENVSFEKVLIVDYAKLQYLITEYSPEDGRFTLSSRIEGEEDNVQRHCRGRLIPQTSGTEPLDLKKLRGECDETVAIGQYYERIHSRGLFYGPTFRPTTEARIGRDSFLIKINAASVAGDSGHPLHPTLFDAALQPVLYCAQGDRLFVPFSIEQFRYFSRPETPEIYAYGRLLSQTDTMLLADIWLLDPHGRVLAHAHRISSQVIDTENQASAVDFLYELAWKESSLDEQPLPDGAEILILADPADSDLTLAEELLAKLPGAAAVTCGAAERDELAILIGGEHQGRSQLIVLWGSRPSHPPLFASGSALPEKIVALFQAIEQSRAGATEVTLVTRGAQMAVPEDSLANLPAFSLHAIAMVAENESEILRCRTIDLSQASPDDPAIIAAEIASGTNGEAAWREGKRFTHILQHPRATENAEQFSRRPVEDPLELTLGAKGKLESLRFEAAERPEPAAGEVELRVHRAALNYKDLLKIYGRLHPTALEGTFFGADFGMECAGIVTRVGPGSRFQPGDRVVAMARRAFRTYAIAPEVFTAALPEPLGMEAAAIPIVYLAAYRGLVEIAQLQPAERVLIHHATGGLGLAAIAIARHLGAEVFATAGSAEKQAVLRSLGIKHIFSSRSLDFGQQIRAATDGEGVDVVLSAQTGQAMHVSLNLLRPGGRYIEVGKKDIAEDNGLPLRPFNRNILFASVDIDRLMSDRPALIRKTLETILAHFARGDFPPPETRTFAAPDFSAAFREMAQSKQIGKLLIDFSSGAVDVLDRPVVQPIVRKDGAYVVTGGTSGFGLMSADWLARQGAGKIILVSRSGAKVAGLAEAVRALEALGAEVKVAALDVTDREHVLSLAAKAAPLPLRGILHSAMILDDALMSDLTPERFRKVFRPKVEGALHLAELAEGSPELDFLVFYSSISALVGNRGQTNYVAANSTLDGLAQLLRARGQPAVSINWGALAESGVVARDERLASALASAGIAGLSNREAFSALEKAIRGASAQLGAFHVEWPRWREAHPNLQGDPRFRELAGSDDSAGGSGVAAEIRRSLAEASREQRLRTLEDHLQEVLASTLKMAKDNIPVNRKLNEMGVDSLMVLELSLGIKERVGVSFSAMEFLKGPNVQQLAALAEQKLWKN